MAAVSGLTHLDGEGRARMIDVGAKAETRRSAIATGRMETTAEVVRLLLGDGLPKADALATARLAGIQGAKRTSELIPLCHGIPLDSVEVELVPEGTAVRISATARTTGKTGVEMEALTAVAIAGLTLHDMVKAVDPAARLTEVGLQSKTGGSRGYWTREGGRAPEAALRPGTAAVVVASTRAASGERPDATGPVISAWLAERGLAVDAVTVVADADVAEAIEEALRARPAVLLTTGGTGLGPGDRTPEATRPRLDAELPGVAEAIRARGLSSVPTAALSRALAGVSRGTLVVNLPGSSGGVRDGLDVLDGLLDHLLQQLAGDADHG